MRVHISNEGDHEPKGLHYMVVDNHGLMVDLSQVQGSLLDPVVTRVTWGPVRVGAEMREGGEIFRQDGGRTTFWDKAALKPYLAAYDARKRELDV